MFLTSHTEGMPMTTPPLAYQLAGHITAETPIAVSYSGMNERLPRTPHGQVFLNGGTLRVPLRKVGLKMLIRELAAGSKPATSRWGCC